MESHTKQILAVADLLLLITEKVCLVHVSLLVSISIFYVHFLSRLKVKFTIHCNYVI